MKKKTKIYALLALCSIMAFTACGDKKDDPANNNLKPDEHKEKLEQIGISLLNEIKPNDMLPATAALSDFIVLFQQIEAPIPNPMQLKRVIERKDLAALSAMSQPNSELFNIADYFGVFTYNYETKEWDRTDSNSEIKFVFKSGGAEAIFRGVCSSETHVIPMEKGNLTIPKSVTVTLSKATTSLLQLEVGIPSLVLNEMKASTKASLTVAGMTMETTVAFEPSACTVTASMNKGTKSLIAFNGNVQVNNFMNPDSLMLNSFNAKIGIMNQCFMFANCPNFLTYIQGMTKIEMDYPANSQGIYGEGKYNAQFALLNQSFNMFINYDGSETKAINMEMGGQYHYEEYTDEGGTYHYERADMIPYFIFTDGSKHSGEEFFTQAAFSDLISKVGELAQEFAQIFGGQPQ